MNALELSKAIGQHATVRLEQTLFVSVSILDAKKVYGTIRYLITPVSGTGSQWVNADRVTIQEKEEVQS